MPATLTRPKTKDKAELKNKILPPFNVILMNDNFHTVDYVVGEVGKKVFGYPVERGLQIAKEVHEKGRCIVWTGAKEVAELKQEQIHALGKDPQVKGCKGPMTAVLEPAA